MRQLNWINLRFVLFWGSVSFLSTFNDVINDKWDLCSIFVNGDLVWDIFNPLLLWIIAFLGEYIFLIVNYNKETFKLDERWTIVSYRFLLALFVLFYLMIHLKESYRIFGVILIFLCMMGLKTTSLYVVCPRQKIQSV